MGFNITPGGLNWANNPSGNFSLGAQPAPFDYGAQMPMSMGIGQGSTPSYGMGTSGGAPSFNAPANTMATPAATSIPGAGGAAEEGGWFTRNMGTVKDVAGILGGFGQVWAGLQANKIAKDTLNFQKKSYETNLANQIKSYNLGLEDRIRSRYAQNERSTSDADAMIAANRM